MMLSWCHACSSILGTRERCSCWTRVPYLWQKKRVSKRDKRASALGWNMDTQTLIYFALRQLGLMVFFPFGLLSFSVTGHSRPTDKSLPCPHKWTACIATSLKHHFVRGLRNKKTRVYYYFNGNKSIACISKGWHY